MTLGFGTIYTRPPKTCVFVLLAVLHDALREHLKMKAYMSDPLGSLGAEGILGWHRNTITLPDSCRIIIFHYFYCIYTSGILSCDSGDVVSHKLLTVLYCRCLDR